LALVPFATAGAQAPPTTGGDADQTIEGSAPPGGSVDCESAPTLTPDHGPPGTEVTASDAFIGNCDDVVTFFLSEMTCLGHVSGEPPLEGFDFPVDVNFVGENAVEISGTFTAPPTEPNPPVVDAIEPLVVTITCTVPPGQQSSGAEGDDGTTTYVYPPAIFDLELFAANDGDQPTLVDNDVVDTPVDPGVVTGSPTFTG
jgi:hypothetical protein